MPLSLAVGFLSETLIHDWESASELIADIELINHTLQKVDLPCHKEPIKCPLLWLNLCGYHGLRRLRRFAAYLNYGKEIPPPYKFTLDEKPDPILTDYYCLRGYREAKVKLVSKDSVLNKGRFNHLILHSDSCGYYVPQDFNTVLYTESNSEMGEIGSAIQLMRELETIAHKLQLPLNIEPKSKSFQAIEPALSPTPNLWQYYWIESHTCLSLYYAAKHSVKHHSLMCYR